MAKEKADKYIDKPDKTLHATGRSVVLTEPLTSKDVAELEHIEAFFFAYRDFVADADRILEKLGFGRAHHRVLFFVNRRTGMTVAELLDILKITKQSLSRVLRQLMTAGYVAQQTGSKDRRQRLLYPTQKGRDLVLELSRPQSHRLHAALKRSGLNGNDVVARFMTEMTNTARKS